MLLQIERSVHSIVLLSPAKEIGKMPKSAAPSITGHVAAIRKLSSIQAPSVLFENLYFVIRDLMGKFWTSRKYRNVSESSKEMIREAGTRLIVCGQGFDKGQITRLLNSTRLICESVLEILLDLGRLLTGRPLQAPRYC